MKALARNTIHAGIAVAVIAVSLGLAYTAYQKAMAEDRVTPMSLHETPCQMKPTHGRISDLTGPAEVLVDPAALPQAIVDVWERPVLKFYVVTTDEAKFKAIARQLPREAGEVIQAYSPPEQFTAGTCYSPR